MKNLETMPAKDREHNPIELEHKLDFYNCSLHYFKDNRVFEFIQLLEKTNTPDPADQKSFDEGIYELKFIWQKCLWHQQDMEQIRRRDEFSNLGATSPKVSDATSTITTVK